MLRKSRALRPIVVNHVGIANVAFVQVEEIRENFLITRLRGQLTDCWNSLDPETVLNR